jgi:cell division protein FtsQ
VKLKRSSKRSSGEELKGPKKEIPPSRRPPAKKVSRVDPRIRRRRIAIRKKRVRRWLLLSGTVVVTAGVVAGAWLVLHSSVFSARVVDVTGSAHTPRSVIVRTAGLAGHPPLIDVNTSKAANALERLAWVKTAAVTLEWPDGVHVALTERKPVASVKGNGGDWALVDRYGRVLEVAASPFSGVPQLLGPSEALVSGSFLKGIGAALLVASTLPRAFSAQVTQVVERAGARIELKLTEPVDVTLGSATDLGAKYEDIASIIAGASLNAGDTIDVSVASSPTVSGP